MSSLDGAYGFGPKGIVFAAKSHFDPSENKCGVCYRGGAETKWLNPASEFAHKSCLEATQGALDLIDLKINELFSAPELTAQKQNVRFEALKGLQEVLEGSSLLDIVKTSGIDKLSILIINVSIPIIKEMHKKLS